MATPRYLLKLRTEVEIMQQLGYSLDAVNLKVQDWVAWVLLIRIILLPSQALSLNVQKGWHVVLFGTGCF